MTEAELNWGHLLREWGMALRREPASWPVLMRVMVCMLAAVILFSVIAFLWLIALHRDVQHYRQYEPELKELLLQRFQHRQHAYEYCEHLEQLKADSALREGFVQDRQTPLLLDQITQEAERRNIHLDEVLMLPESQEEVHVSVPIRISATGDYPALIEFLAGIASARFRLSLHDLAITPAATAKESALHLSIEARAYRLVPGSPS